MPLHAAVVHVPLGLALISPLVYLVLAILIWKKWLPPRAWILALLIQSLLLGSALYAEKLGHHDHEKVEDVIEEKWVEGHEERAEIFIRVEAGVFVFVAMGFLPWLSFADKLRCLAFLTSVVALYFAYQTGHSGGELVYVKGAAKAYFETSVAAPPTKE